MHAHIHTRTYSQGIATLGICTPFLRFEKRLNVALLLVELPLTVLVGLSGVRSEVKHGQFLASQFVQPTGGVEPKRAAGGVRFAQPVQVHQHEDCQHVAQTVRRVLSLCLSGLQLEAQVCRLDACCPPTGMFLVQKREIEALFVPESSTRERTLQEDSGGGGGVSMKAKKLLRIQVRGAGAKPVSPSDPPRLNMRTGNKVCGIRIFGSRTPSGSAIKWCTVFLGLLQLPLHTTVCLLIWVGIVATQVRGFGEQMCCGVCTDHGLPSCSRDLLGVGGGGGGESRTDCSS